MRTADAPVLPPKGSRVLCAVSGGADSVCLLHMLLHGGRELTVLAAHYNHGLRGAEADRDEAFVRSLCEEWGVPLRTGRGDVARMARERGESIETAARNARYAFLEQTAAETGAEYIATAHTASDNAETVLLQLARGTGSRGLGGIPPQRGRIVRPLLDMTRAEVEAYLEKYGLAHVEDSTNAEEDAARNRIRHAAVPALRSVNARAEANILRASRLARADEELLTAMAREKLALLRRGEALDVPGLRELPEPLQYRVLREFTGGELSFVHFEALRRLIASDDGSAELSLPGRKLRREYGRLLPAGEKYTLPELELIPGSTAELPGLRIRTELLPDCREIQTSFTIFSFSYGKICGKLTLTPRRAGDSIAFVHRRGTRTLHRLLIDAGVPAARRDSVPVLRDEAGVLAVYGFGQSERAFAAPGETVLRITIEKIEENRQ